MRNKILSILTHRYMLVTFFLGISSGLPFALSHGTLQAWFTHSGLSLKEIGWVGVAVFPYNFKFLWAPLLDKYVPPFLGRRRGWISIFQLLLSLTIASMAWFSPKTHPQLLFGLACLMSFLSASQDIVVDAYRTDLLPSDARALGGALAQNGYRIAMMISGGVALLIADRWGWKFTYLFMAALMASNTVVTLFAKEASPVNPPRTLSECVILPFKDFLKNQHAGFILIFIVFYKLGDAFAGSLNQTFLMREVQMTLTEIGSLVKGVGLVGVLSGSLTGGLLVLKMGWFRSLFLFGLLQAVTNLAYMPLMWTGPHYGIAAFALFIEDFCGGMASAAFGGLLMNLCNARFSATQFALFSSLAAVGVSFIKPLAAWVAQDYGWVSYYMGSLVLAIPGLVLLVVLRKSIEAVIQSKRLAV